jgi:hypothetical protein
MDQTTQLTFAGIPINGKGRIERVRDITEKFKKELGDLGKLNIPLHQKLTLFRVCANHE